MKPLWDRSGQASAELEALQTDVMRFLAILGLCLAAIFSLLRSAEQERAPPETVAESEAVAVRAPAFRPILEPITAEKPPLEVTRPVPVEPAGPARDEGFTLEFESSEAMSRLLGSGLVSVYMIHDGQFYSYSQAGVFAPIDAPDSYYAMQAETVPPQLRALTLGLNTGDKASWGVNLPSTTASQLQDLLTANRGGALIIDAQGAVRLE